MKTPDIFSFVVLAALCSAAPSFAEVLTVVTKQDAIRQECRFISPVKAKVKFNDKLELISQEQDWFKVKYSAVKGCIHKNAITVANVDLSEVKGKGYSGSSDEVALAGKGFNKEVEKEYKSKHPELNFGAVDSIEAFTVSDAALQGFIKSGGLTTP